MSGASDNSIPQNLQQETVPPGYTVHKWTPGDHAHARVTDKSSYVTIHSRSDRISISCLLHYYHDEKGVPI